MNKTLILTGKGHSTYDMAAVLALRHFGLDTELLSISKRRLPEFLENPGKYSEIVILGVSLTGDAERLAQALKALQAKGTHVLWLSGLDFPKWMGDDVRSNLESYIIPNDDISDVVADYYQLDYSEFADFFNEEHPLGKSYSEFLEAVEYFYRNYQDEQSYPRVIRHIANKDGEEKWSDNERQMIEHYRRYGNRELLGKSDLITSLQEKINLLAGHDRTRVLILGESGTGKETVAAQLHNKSKRKSEPYITFNCASSNPQLLESAFLGHEKNAFTGANERRIGIFEAADGGSLFLDEIGELPLETQGILLRILEEGRFKRMGESAKEVTVDVRVIAATNRDLPTMVRDGKFRLDLYQRLSVIQLRAPALREHKEDIGIISYNYRHKNKMGGWLSKEQVEALQSYDFPGNVRELYNLLERAYIFSITDYRQLIREHRELNAALLPQDKVEVPDNLEEAIRLHVKHVVEKCNGNITRAAEALGASRNTVRKYLE